MPLNTLAYGLLIHMLVAFPDGRLDHPRPARVMTLVWFVVTVAAVAVVPFIDPTIFRTARTVRTTRCSSAATRASRMCCCGVQTFLAVAAHRRAWSWSSSGAGAPRRPPSAARSGARAVGGRPGDDRDGGPARRRARPGVDDAVNRALYIACARRARAVPFAFLFGLLRSRLRARARSSELVAALGEARERRASLRDALADALGDPTLELAYWLPDRARYVDADGPADRAARPRLGPAPGTRSSATASLWRRSSTTRRSPRSAS